MTDQYGRTAERSRLGQARFSWRWSLRISGPDDDATQNSSLWRVAWLPVLLLLFTLACGREPGIIVNIAEWPAGVERIRVKTTIEGTAGTDIFLAKDQTRFAVRVPASSQGTVHLVAEGLDATDCKLATGSLTEPVPSNLSRFVERTIVLSALTFPVCLFAHGTVFKVGTTPGAVAVGDFNGDLLSDIVVANSGSDSVSVLLGGAEEVVLSPTLLKFAVGSAPDAVAVGYFNGDLKLDLAVALGNSNTVGVLLGDGVGGFAPPVSVIVGKNPSSVAVGDFNGDMKSDLVVTNLSEGTVSVVLGDGNGGFSVDSTLPVGSGPYIVAVGDLNGDMKPDLAVVNGYGSTVSVLLGNGFGRFSSATPFSVGKAPKSVVIEDFSGDMKPDLAVANFTSSNVSVLLGNGVGDFSEPTNFLVGKAPYPDVNPSSVAIGDFDGDKQLDLVTANYSQNSVSVLVNDGKGGFSSASNFPVGTNPRSVAVGDFNGDMRPDLVVANASSNNVSILLNQF